MKYEGSGKPTPRIIVLTVALAALLLIKFCWSLTVSAVPFGYDAGIYRALFTWHAMGWPPFMPMPVPPWAQSHPLGLFAFSSLLLKMGMPVDVLLGWGWNLFAAVPAFVLAAVMWKSRSPKVAVALLCVAVLSVAQYEGFIAMYAKVFAALAWCALALHLFELRNRWWVLPGMFVLATHLQVGLILGVTVVSWCVQRFVAGSRKDALFGAWTGILALALGGAWYWQNFVYSVLPSAGKVVASVDGSAVLMGICILALAMAAFLSMRRVSVAAFARPSGTCAMYGVLLLVALGIGQLELHPQATPSGSFLPALEYVWLSFPLLLLSCIGLALSVRSNRCGDTWQWAVVWSAAFVLAKFFFYLRFLLLLDFFLLPFAAIALEELWCGSKRMWRWLAILFVCVQCILAVQRLQQLRPEFSTEQLQAIAVMEQRIAPRSTVLVLDTSIAPWAMGLLPRADVVAPGMFQSPSYKHWEQFMYGTHADRVAFFGMFRKPAFVYAGPAFHAFYPSEVQSAVLQDPCMQPAGEQGWYAVSCP